MAFYQVSGPVNTQWFPKKASTVMAVGSALTFDGSGYVTNATSTSTRVAGVNLKTIASTDSDYAATTLIPVHFPGSQAIFLADVGSGTATAANIGVQYDFNDATGVNLGASSHKQVTVVGVIDASHVLVTLAAYTFANAS